MKKISGAAINALKEALISIYWYKADLVSYLKYTLRNPNLILQIDPAAMKRNIVTSLIDKMASREEVYQGDLLRLMIETAKFDDFSHLKQLEEGGLKVRRAIESVSALKSLVAGHQKLVDELQGLEEKRRIEHELSLKNKGIRDSLENLTINYKTFFTLKAQERGYALEKLLWNLFELFDLDPKASFKIVGEQIDGAFTFDTTDYILECKWQDGLVSAATLDVFKGKLSRKLDNTLGLFLSINGYSPDAVDLHSTGRGMMILMDGQDLMAVLEGRIGLGELLLRKRKYAAQTGNIYLKIDEII